MTGQELFHALSYVDARYIAEAETAVLGRNTPWMKVISVAACLCILITGVYAYGRMQTKSAMGAAPEAEAPAAAEPFAPQADKAQSNHEVPEEAPKQEAADGAPAQEVDETRAPGELHRIPFARLRIINVLEEGFEAVVEAVPEEPMPLEVGSQVILIVDPDKVPAGGERTDVEYEKTAAVDQRIVIENGAYDAGINTLYVEGVIPEEGE